MSVPTPATTESTPDDEAIIDASEFDGPDFLTDPYPLYRPASAINLRDGRRSWEAGSCCGL